MLEVVANTFAIISAENLSVQKMKRVHLRGRLYAAVYSNCFWFRSDLIILLDNVQDLTSTIFGEVNALKCHSDDT